MVSQSVLHQQLQVLSTYLCVVKSNGYTKQIKRRIQSKKARRVPQKQPKKSNGGKNGKIS